MKKSNTAPLTDSLPWEDIMKVSKNDLFKKKFYGIERDQLQFAADEENISKVIESALNVLKKTNSDATLEQAEKLAVMMQSFAKRVLDEEKN